VSIEGVLLLVSSVVGIAGALGVAYAVFRSASEGKLRELDKRIIENQQALLTQTEAELTRERTRAQAAENNAITYRDALTQKAAVDHLLEVLVREEQARHQEHTEHGRRFELQAELLREILTELKARRGSVNR
jgi:hypothetical protein